MKKSALTAAITLLAAAAMVSCSKSESDINASAKGPEDGVTNIRFYSLDSVQAHYKLFEQLSAQTQASMENIENISRQKQNQLLREQQRIVDKQNNHGYLSQQSLEADYNAYANMEQQAQQHINALQMQLQQELADNQQRLLDSINNFLAAYNKVNKFDAIMVINPGFVVDPRLDITDEVVNGLNDRYQSADSTEVKK